NVTGLMSAGSISAGTTSLTGGLSGTSGTFSGTVTASVFVGNHTGTTGTFSGGVSAATANVTGLMSAGSISAGATSLTGPLTGTTGTFSGTVTASVLSGTHTGTWSGNTIGVANGGTGLTTIGVGNIPFGNGSSAMIATGNLVYLNGSNTVKVTTGTIQVGESASWGTHAKLETGQLVFWNMTDSGFIKFYPTGSSVEQMRIKNGYIGIGTSTPAQKLDVAGTVQATAFVGDGSGLTYLDAGDISSGTLPVSRGGTGLGTVAANGQLLVGNGTGYTLSTLTGTTGQVQVVNGAGTITLSLPQTITTTANPTFGGAIINGELSVTNANSDGIKVLSGNTSYWAGIGIGRVSPEAHLGVANTAGYWVSNSSAGDIVLRSDLSTNRVIVGAGSGVAPLVVTSTNVGIGTAVPNGQYKVDVAGTLNATVVSGNHMGTWSGSAIG
ncbi:hypothetical protein EB093_09600, partial [bacterium]|nr:hypothetical protein [bacterium]